MQKVLHSPIEFRRTPARYCWRNIALSLTDKWVRLASAGLVFRMTASLEPPTHAPKGLCHKRAAGFAPIYVNWAFLDTFVECLRAGFVVAK